MGGVSLVPERRMGRHMRYSRPKTQPPETLLDYLCSRFPYLSREAWENHLSAGHFTVNGESGASASGDYVLCQGDCLCFSPPRELEPDVDEHISTLHSDEMIIVCVKNGNLPVAEGGRYSGNTLVGLLQRRHGIATGQTQRKRKHCNGNRNASDTEESLTCFHPVHRLDKETSGLVVLAKQPSAARFLSTQFEEQSELLTAKLAQRMVSGLTELSAEVFDELLQSEKAVMKSYTAVLAGTAKVGSVYVVSDRIGMLAEDPTSHVAEHSKLRKLKMACFPAWDARGRIAATRVWIIGSDAEMCVSVARVDILTGRTHQIRLHCAQLGLPVLGDKLYETRTPGERGACCAVADDVYIERARGAAEARSGSVPRLAVRRHLLHATVLAFRHPMGGERALYFADPREWFMRDILETSEAAAVDALQRLLDGAMESPAWRSFMV